LNLTNTSVNASPTEELGESTKSTILNANPEVTATVDASIAMSELPVVVEPVEPDCTSAK
jgi:hypothetical protein